MNREKYWTEQIDKKDEEIKELRKEIKELHGEIKELHGELHEQAFEGAYYKGLYISIRGMLAETKDIDEITVGVIDDIEDILTEE